MTQISLNRRMNKWNMVNTMEQYLSLKSNDHQLFSSIQFSHSVVPDSLWSHGLQQARPPCPSPTPRVYSNSCPLSWMVMPSNHLILCRPLLLPPSIFPSIRAFSNESVLIWWLKYWSFSFNISPSNEYSGLISFRTNWFLSPCSPGDSQESSPTPQFKSINSSVLSLLYGSALTSIYGY